MWSFCYTFMPQEVCSESFFALFPRFHRWATLFMAEVPAAILPDVLQAALSAAEAAAEVPAAGVPAAVIPMDIEYSLYTPPTFVIVLLCVHTPRGPFRVRFCAFYTFPSLSNPPYGWSTSCYSSGCFASRSFSCGGRSWGSCSRCSCSRNTHGYWV